VTAACLLVTGVAVATPTGTSAAAPGPGVFFLGDSVMEGARDTLDTTVVPSYPGAVVDAAVCRGLASSCPYNGSTPTTGLQEIAANAGRIGDVIVVELGYNDAPSAASIDAALGALTAQDVPLVLWVGLSTLNRPEFATENDRLKAATARWPTMRFLDWDGTSHAHPEWFIANDGVGVHLTAAGEAAFVGWLKTQLDAIPGIGIPPPATQHCAAAVAVGQPTPSPSAVPTAAPDPASGFVGTDPRRLLDSRSGRPLGAGRAIELQVAGRAGVPASASAAVLNVTAVDPCAAGFLTVFPCGAAAPLASNVDYAAADVRPTLAVARLGPGGRACIYSMVQTDVVVDLIGWFDATGGAAAVAQAPVRLIDTRTTGRVTGGTAFGFAAAPAGTPGVILDVTGVDARAPGYLTVWPAAADGSCDAAARPATSNVNVDGSDPVANAVIVRTGGRGRVCVYSLTDIDVVIDLDGTLAAAGTGTLHATTPQRVLDTRNGTGGVTGTVAAGGVVAVTIGTGAVGAVLTVTAVQPDDRGFLTVWPAAADGSCQAVARPLASNLNYSPGQVVANLAVTSVGGAGRVCIYSLAATHVVADLTATIASIPPT